MSERKEKTMLKWLKQKPTHGHGGLPLQQTLTDDPLATIQVHPHAKKSKNKTNEIYAVSRVNPLFEEEDGKEVFSPGGHSGSSGYDSGSGPSDDDFNVAGDLKDLHGNILGRLNHPSTIVAAAAISPNHPQLFINTENDVIHHEKAVVGSNGRPVLQILEQNPNYVKSIALSVANNNRKRPLSPISESAQQAVPIPTSHIPKPTSNARLNALSKFSQNASSPGPGPHFKDAKSTVNNAKTNPVDSVGNAKLVKKDTQFVRSIRIGGGPSGLNNLANNTQAKRSLLEANANRRFSSSSSSSSNGPSRRPSVTFADDVGASRPGSRKPSVEQDSIVTDSLLMMTSSAGSGLPDTRRFANAINTSATNNSRRASVSSAHLKGHDDHSTAESEIVSSEQDTVDLEAFANSLRKSRPIKQPSSASSSSNNNASSNSRSQGSISDEVDDTSSSSSNPSEGYDTSSTPPNERRATVNSATLTKATGSSAIPRHKSHKSPFGGIADHYAAAKEIAKEIESYSNGSAKASSKKSLVRDLLYRGNRNAANSVSTNDTINAIRIGTTNSNFGTNNAKNVFRTARGNGRDGTITKEPRHLSTNPHLDPQVVLAKRSSSPIFYGEPIYGATSAKFSGNQRGAAVKNTPTSKQEVTTTIRGGAGSVDWELVRVQQVYVKAESSSQDQQQQHRQQPAQNQRKSDKEGESSSVSSTSRNDPSGRTVGHQGQDHPASTSTNANSTGNSRRHPSPSLTAGTTPKPPLSSSSAASTTRGKASKKVPTTDDGLAAGARSRVRHDDDTDSGNSSDRTYAEVRLEIEGAKIDISGEKISETTIQVEEDSNSSSENLPSKVMIVTGDSQNIVVDLSGVPLELKNAIVSGTALITLPDGLDQLLRPGYTMITIPATSSKPVVSLPKSPVHTQLVVDGISSVPANSVGVARSNNLSKKDGVMNITIGIDDNKPLFPPGGGSSASGSDDECKLFGTKNKAQIWDVIQSSIKQQDSGGGKGKKKRITTVFPYHPNQDTYQESPDFTIEGHRMDRQRKKVEHEKKRRCACRICGMLFFLVAFLGVLVTLSMIYTRGQRYFGSV